MRSRVFSISLLCASLLGAQAVRPTAVVNVPAPRKMVLQHGAGEAKIRVEIANGYHINSNKPSEDYLIPVKLDWAPGALAPAGIDFPAPQMEKYSFSDKPIAVYSSDFTITARFRAPKGATSGVVTGKLRYQACTNSLCLPPRTVEIRLPYEAQ